MSKRRLDVGCRSGTDVDAADVIEEVSGFEFGSENWRAVLYVFLDLLRDGNPNRTGGRRRLKAPRVRGAR